MHINLNGSFLLYSVRHIYRIFFRWQLPCRTEVFHSKIRTNVCKNRWTKKLLNMLSTEHLTRLPRRLTVKLLLFVWRSAVQMRVKRWFLLQAALGLHSEHPKFLLIIGILWKIIQEKLSHSFFPTDLVYNFFWNRSLLPHQLL